MVAYVPCGVCGHETGLSEGESCEHTCRACEGTRMELDGGSCLDCGGTGLRAPWRAQQRGHAIHAQLDAAVKAADERVRTCHERLACPKCWAPVGVECRALPRGYRLRGLCGRVVKPHVERWSQETPVR